MSMVLGELFYLTIANPVDAAVTDVTKVDSPLADAAETERGPHSLTFLVRVRDFNDFLMNLGE